MEKKIKLVYWDEPNFGDVLSPYIIGRLSKEKVICKKPFCSVKHCIKVTLQTILLFRFEKIKSIHFWWESNLLGIGSIISWGNKHSVIWGSGFIDENQTFKGGTIYAVRGKYTYEKLKKDGFVCPPVFGDPALLIPLLISPSKVKTTNIAIIPHWSETDYFIEKYGNKYKIIDLRTSDINKVISEITSSHMILSTSLHGIIVSHAYGIPALWIKYKTLHNSNFKFYDYFSSVGIKEYEGLDYEEILSSEHNYISCFKNNKEISLPNVDIKLIQKNILEAAPFDIALNLL